MRFLSTAFLKFRLLALKPACNIDSPVLFMFIAGLASKSTGSGADPESRYLKLIRIGNAATLFPPLNNCSMIFRLLSLSTFPSVFFVMGRCLSIRKWHLTAKSPATAGLNIVRCYSWRLLEATFVRNSQFLTTLLPTACKYLTAIGCLHTLTKTVDTFTAAPVWLECAFHCFLFLILLTRSGTLPVEKQASFQTTARAPSRICRERDGKGNTKT